MELVEKQFVAIDVETTTLAGMLTSVAVVTTDSLRDIDASRVEVLELKDAPQNADIRRALAWQWVRQRIARDSVVVGHNLKLFDVPHLVGYALHEWTYRTIDTIDIAMMMRLRGSIESASLPEFYKHATGRELERNTDPTQHDPVQDARAVLEALAALTFGVPSLEHATTIENKQNRESS